MNTYDFDNTIFRGDSTVRFWLYCLRTRPRSFRALPRTAWHGLRFALRAEEKTAFKQRFFSFLAFLPDREQALREFWAANFSRLKTWYRPEPEDVIISASPEFLLQPVCDRLGVRLIASRVDPDTGEYTGLNCHGAEKVRRFRERFGDASPDRFYSDSLSDTPMARLAAQSFLVKGDRILPWPESR